MGGSLNKPTTGPERHHADDGAGDSKKEEAFYGGKGNKKSSRNRDRREDTGKGEEAVGNTNGPEVIVPCPSKESVKKGNDFADHLNPFIGHMGRGDKDDD